MSVRLASLVGGSIGTSSLFESLQTLFWGTFGLIDLQTFQIYKKHTFTMFIGLLMYGVYSSIMIIVLLNMLIAMMSNSYQYIAVRSRRRRRRVSRNDPFV